MNNKLLKSVFCLLLVSVGMQAFAKVDLTLNQLRQEVLNENLDIKIQYERYYQSQRNVSVALGQFLPSANINMINVNATFAILQSVVPTPSDWFVYQASKELRVAEKFTSESIKLNILEGLTTNFINLKYHESLALSLAAQEEIINATYEEVKKGEELGTASNAEVFIARRNLLQHRQDMFLLNSLIIAEKQALLIALNKQPSEVLTLGNLPAENLDFIPTKVEDGIALALANSPELVSKSYQAEAARFMVSSKKWSFVSFNGIGFDYAGTLSIERSKERIIELESEQISLKIANQVYSAYDSLSLIDQRITLQKEIVESLKSDLDRSSELYAGNAITFGKFFEVKTQINSEERALVRLEMERKIKIANLKRLLGLDSSLTKEASEYADIKLSSVQESARRGAKNVWVSVDGLEVNTNDIFSVTFSVEGILEDERILAGESELSVFFKAPSKGEYKVSAVIKMISGVTLTRETVVVVK
jgi:outer membrane protein TolC